MGWPIKFWLVFSAVFVIAIMLRVSRLDLRPMHGDEAVHAYKFGRLLEDNYYRYDPQEFHGPALNYFTLAFARLAGRRTYVSLTESQLRSVPVLFGILLVITPLLLADGLGRTTVVIAGAVTSISPAFCFYSRYYISEMLLVFFSFAVIVCGYRYTLNKKWGWALLTGVFVGLCCATKETWVVAFGAMVLALATVLLVHQRAALLNPRHLLLAIGGALVVWALFYSSFFTNLAGLLDFFRGFAVYFSRAAGGSAHVHPWYYYLKLLIFNAVESGPPWTEAVVVVLAVVGGFLIIARKGLDGFDSRLLDFLAVYTLLMLVIYSALSYKTPWCLLGFYHGMILLAAVGVVATLNLIRKKSARVVVAAFFVTAGFDLATQTFTANFISYTDPSNPYVYAHPTKDVFAIAERIKEVSRLQPAGRNMPVWVVCRNSDYWPLPWYLRSFKNVGWCSDVNDIRPPAPVVIASAALEDELIARLYDLTPAGEKNLYVPLFDNPVELRPGIELRGYVTKDLRDKLQKSDAGN